MLHVASAVDPRFKALPFLSDEEGDNTFSRLKTEVVDGMEVELLRVWSTRGVSDILR